MSSYTQIVGLAVGWLAIGYVAVQGLTSAVRMMLRRARWQRQYAEERAEFCRRVEATARAARAAKAIPDWTGWRPFRVAAVVDEAIDVKSFYFTPVDGRPLAPFAPGQYLTFKLRLPDSDAPLVRCYSLSDRPRQEYYRVTIKRIVAPPGRSDFRPGGASRFFHQQLRVGDVVDVRAPAGTFFVDPQSTGPVVLIGAGIGITPLVSMLEASLHGGQREIYALFGFRNSREQPFKERLESLAREHTHFRLHVSHTAPQPNDVLYKDYAHRRRLAIERVREVLPSNNFHFFVCGPGPLMASLVPALIEWGVPQSHMHYEAFGPASVQRTTDQRTSLWEVRFERSQHTAKWDSTLTSLLDFGEAAGVKMISGCRAGSCGECMTAIRSGSVSTLKRPGIDVPPGHCLTCISIPTSELVLEA